MMRIVQGVFWWIVTIVTLFVLDDLVFGPFFWAMALVNPVFSTVAAFVSSTVFQIWLIYTCLKPEPSKPAKFFFKRFMLERKNAEVARREASIKRTASSALGALLVTPLLGALIPVMVMRKHQLMSEIALRRYAFVLLLVYAAVFAAVHGGYGLGGLVRMFVGT